VFRILVAGFAGRRAGRPRSQWGPAGAEALLCSEDLEASRRADPDYSVVTTLRSMGRSGARLQSAMEPSQRRIRGHRSAPPAFRQVEASQAPHPPSPASRPSHSPCARRKGCGPSHSRRGTPRRSGRCAHPGSRHPPGSRSPPSRPHRPRDRAHPPKPAQAGPSQLASKHTVISRFIALPSVRC
jgi:hypothetical protein